MKTNNIYFGGSRNSINMTTALSPILTAVAENGNNIHVGCQYGADQMVIYYANPKILSVYAVAPSLHLAPAHVQQAAHNGASVTLSAGGTTAPIPARYLLRSIAAFHGCEQAVFFSPGSGSLAVARECVHSGLPVFAFGAQPAPVPSCKGAWFTPAWFMGFQCWAWGAYSAPKQYSLF